MGRIKFVGRGLYQEGVWLEGFLYIEGYTPDRLGGEKGHVFHRKELYGHTRTEIT